jgi:hypothetical protein
MLIKLMLLCYHPDNISQLDVMLGGLSKGVMPLSKSIFIKFHEVMKFHEMS